MNGGKSEAPSLSHRDQVAIACLETLMKINWYDLTSNLDSERAKGIQKVADMAYQIADAMQARSVSGEKI